MGLDFLCRMPCLVCVVGMYPAISESRTADYTKLFIALIDWKKWARARADRKLYEKTKKAGLALMLDEYDNG